MNWIDNKDVEESLVILGQLSEVCASQGGPLTRSVNDLVRARQWRTLVDYEIDYSLDFAVDDFLYARQILGFFQKSEWLPVEIDRERVAASRFVESERICFATNARFAHHSVRDRYRSPSVESVLFAAQRKISDVLGDIPSLDELQFAFGPGANTNVNGRCANPRAKLSASLVCSSNLAPTVAEFLSEVPQWCASHAVSESEDSYTVNVTVHPGKVMFVPKNAKTNRSIVVEPLLNSFFQKGFGSYIRRRLKRFNVNLRDQSFNQRAALKGSIDGSLATVDLSMASDCIARNLVFDLLPYDWAELLDRLCTSSVILPLSVDVTELPVPPSGGVYSLQKFSSMGNGFTFELESMIFYALAYSTCKHLGLDASTVLTYGDDIIIPVGAAPLLEEVLSECGFALNQAKSYSSGNFRESCGADYYSGFDIRPFYQKTLISERTLYTMHNWFIRSCEWKLAEAVRQLCNQDLILFGPDGFGDGHLIGSHCLRLNRARTRDGWCGGYFDTYTLRPRSFKRPLPGDAVLPTYSVYTRSGKESPTDPDAVRGSRGYAKISIYTLGCRIFSRKHYA